MDKIVSSGSDNSFLHEVSHLDIIPQEIRNDIERRYKLSKANSSYKFPRLNPVRPVFRVSNYPMLRPKFRTNSSIRLPKITPSPSRRLHNSTSFATFKFAHTPFKGGLKAIANNATRKFNKKGRFNYH